MSRIPNYQTNLRRDPGGSTSGLAIASMVLGICSLVLICFWHVALPAAAAAIVLGILARSQFAAGQGGRGMAIAGIVCGSVALCLCAVVVAGVVALFHYGGPIAIKAQQQLLQQIQQYQMQHPKMPTTTQAW